MNDEVAFSLEEKSVEGVAVLQPVGELDISAAGWLRDRLHAAATASPSSLIVVDCSGLTFVDSSGISVLAHAHLRVEAAGGELRLAALPSRVARVLELSGLIGVLRSFPDIESALTAPRAEPHHRQG
ncbi:MAG: anti sigma factor [Acidimicrobiaceae bacterium]|nr:anti sigma factor [Acidimicrobiaceae bacterium]